MILVALMAMMTWRSGDTDGDVTLVFVTPLNKRRQRVGILPFCLWREEGASFTSHKG